MSDPNFPQEYKDLIKSLVNQIIPLCEKVFDVAGEYNTDLIDPSLEMEGLNIVITIKPKDKRNE